LISKKCEKWTHDDCFFYFHWLFVQPNIEASRNFNVWCVTCFLKNVLTPHSPIFFLVPLLFVSMFTIVCLCFHHHLFLQPLQNSLEISNTWLFNEKIYQGVCTIWWFNFGKYNTPYRSIKNVHLNMVFTF